MSISWRNFQVCTVSFCWGIQRRLGGAFPLNETSAKVLERELNAEQVPGYHAQMRDWILKNLNASGGTPSQ